MIDSTVVGINVLQNLKKKGLKVSEEGKDGLTNLKIHAVSVNENNSRKLPSLLKLCWLSLSERTLESWYHPETKADFLWIKHMGLKIKIFAMKNWLFVVPPQKNAKLVLRCSSLYSETKLKIVNRIKTTEELLPVTTNLLTYVPRSSRLSLSLLENVNCAGNSDRDRIDDSFDTYLIELFTKGNFR